MLTIDKAITEAQAEEMAEREANNSMKEGYKNAPANNTVTVSLGEYISLYNSTDKYCKLLALICGLATPCNYETDGVRLSSKEEILAFLKYNETEVYADMVAHVAELKERGEDV